MVQQWFIDNRKIWLNTINDKEAEKRCGLLSGFPRNAVDQFTLFSASLDKARNIRLNLPGKEAYLFQNYIKQINDFQTEEDKVALTKILEESGNFSQEEIFLLTSRINLDSPASPFFGFSKEDEKWARNSCILYQTVMSDKTVGKDVKIISDTSKSNVV